MIRFVATLPPQIAGDEARLFARVARAQGASLLEVRTDLTPLHADLGPLAQELPLLVAQRSQPVPEAWRSAASLWDQDVRDGSSEGVTLRSLHADSPITSERAEQLWEEAKVLPGQLIKHVEPLGAPSSASRLFETQARLKKRYGDRVTVLAMGPLALPFRALLSQDNALEYCAVDSTFAAAPGQRLLQDAVRAQKGAGRMRLGILGTRISGSRSPHIHVQPFDRLDLPEDAPLGELVESLRPYYRGFAVTSPFKRPIAALVSARIPAVNTLVRAASGWRALNTDVMGAGRVLDRLTGGQRRPVAFLGDGGVTDALRVAANERGLEFRVLRRHQIGAEPLFGLAVWTWPPEIDPPPSLRFHHAEVAVVSYGKSGRHIASRIQTLGGTPRRLGAAWFVAQARFQRALWETAV